VSVAVVPGRGRSGSVALVVFAAAALGVVAAPPARAAGAQDAALIARGEQLYVQKACAACHGPNVGPAPGRQLPGTAGLRKRYGTAKPAVLAERTDLDAAYVKLIVRKGLNFMPFFRKTEVSDADLEAIAAYLARTTPR
jgi:(+)-pinoresinol hydroxylase